MKKAVIISIISFCLSQYSHAQVGKVGINTTTPNAMLHVKDSSVLFTGSATLPVTPGNPPSSGAGSRMMWYPAKAAFRSGLVTGTQWDKINIGQYSFSSGYNTISKGDYTTSFGHTTLASGAQSTAFGSSTQAIGTNTTSLGSGSIANGFNSTAIGVSTQANGYASTVIGQWNDTIVSSQTTMSGTTPLFIIGKGDNAASRSNALVVRKDGNIGIGMSNPGFLLNFPTATGDKISLYGNSGNHFGFGIQTSLLQIYTDNNLGDVAFGFGSSGSFTETMRIKGNGKVGIGTSTPAYPLNFANTVGDKISLWGADVFHYGFGIQSGLLQIHTSAVGEDIAFGHGSSATFTERVRIKGNGNVGIGTSTPGFPLNFSNALGAKISLWGNSGAHFGLGIQNALLQIYTDIPASDIAFGYGSSAALTETMRIKGNGNVGIATNAPEFKLDINGRMRIRHGADGSPGIWFNRSDNSSAIAFMGLLNDDYVGLYGSQGSAWNFVMSTITGNIGIGLQSPTQKLHVNGGGLFNGVFTASTGASGATANGNAIGVFERNTAAYINILTPAANESGLLFGNPLSSIHGGILYNTSGNPNGMQFRTNGNVNRMVLTSTGSLGVGTTSPLTRLHIKNGNSNADLFSTDVATFESNGDTRVNLAAGSGDVAGIRFNHPTDSGGIYFNKGNIPNGFRFEVGDNSVAMVINELGWVGLGTSLPGAQFDCNNARIYSLGVGANPPNTHDLNVGGTGYFSGTVTASCGVLTCSDKRYKTNIQPLTNSLTNVLSLSGILYHWDRENFPDKDFNDHRQLGIIAQELEQVYPELVHTDEEGYKTVDYSRLSPVLLEAIKEQQLMIYKQNQKIHTQGELLKSQQEQIDFLLKEFLELKEKTKTVVNREW